MFCLVAAHCCASGCGHGHCPNAVCTVHNACYVRKVSCLEFALMFAVSHMNML